MKHLSPEQIVSYTDRRLAGADLLAADDHLAECPECRGKVSGDSEAALLSLARTLESPGMDDGHLEYELIRAYVDGEQPLDAREAMESHLRECQWCRAEVDDLLLFAERIKLQPRRRPAVSRWIVGGAIAAALIVGVMLKKPHAEPSAALKVSLRDGGSLIGLDGEGHLSAPANLSPADRDALTAALRDASLPVTLDDRLRSNRSVLLGADQRDAPFQVLSPIGQAVLADRPKFTWQPLTGARSYKVEIFDASYSEVLSSSPVEGTSWTPDRPLGRGKLYEWQVTAVGSGEPLKAPQPPEPEARFEVVDEVAAAAIEEAQASSSPLLLASRYAAAGLCTEALGELSALDAANPGSPLLSRMRAGLETRCLEKNRTP